MLAIGFVLPENLVIPVKGADSSDWNHDTFWYEPWGKSVVHKGIDIFGDKSTPVISPTNGVIIYRGNIDMGGNIILLLGPKWRVHYLAHLETIEFDAGLFVQPGSQIGTLGDTGNAIGKQPHVHYSIISLIPYIWKVSTETQGWKKMFYLNPHEKLSRL